MSFFKKTLTYLHKYVQSRFSICRSDKIPETQRNLTQEELDFISRVEVWDYSGIFMHISFDDVSKSLEELFSHNHPSIYSVEFFKDLKGLHEKYGACFSLYVFSDKLDNVNDRYKMEFQQAKDWLRFNFHAYKNKKYGRRGIKGDYDKGIERLLVMVGGDYDCLDGQFRASYWELSLRNSLYIKNHSLHKSYIFCARDPFSPVNTNYYLTKEQQNLVYYNAIYPDVGNGIIFIQTCARLDTDEFCRKSMKLISENINWQKYCEVLNHEWGFNRERMEKFLEWAKNDMNFRFGFFEDIFKIRQS